MAAELAWMASAVLVLPAGLLAAAGLLRGNPAAAVTLLAGGLIMALSEVARRRGRTPFMVTCAILGLAALAAVWPAILLAPVLVPYALWMLLAAATTAATPR